MAKDKREFARRQTNALSDDEAEELFSKLDETGHVNEDIARQQRLRRQEGDVAVAIDPLAGEDPSGSNVGKVMTKTAIAVVIIFLVVVVLAQVSCGIARRANTADLSSNVNVRTVASAIQGGVEWGNGFTQFPEDFSVQEADENTGRVEVTVIDTTSSDVLECFAGSQIQASALSVNALLNPSINTVIYHVNAHMDANGKFEKSQLFGFLKPTGDVTAVMTFVWTKTQSSSGVSFSCTITGVSDELEEQLHDSVTTSFTPVKLLGLDSSTSTSSSSDSSSSASSSSDASSGSTSSAQ